METQKNEFKTKVTRTQKDRKAQMSRMSDYNRKKIRTKIMKSVLCTRKEQQITSKMEKLKSIRRQAWLDNL